MSRWLEALHDQLEQRRRDGLLRTLRPVEPSGPRVRDATAVLINAASNDYLGLSQHPRLIAAARDAAERFGVGAGASRLVSGTAPLHAQVEQRFASFKHAQAALLTPTGYTANLAVLTALAGPGDLICLDKLSHASLVDAARASGATVRVVPHLDLLKHDRLLLAHQQASPTARRLLVTDSVFSMDGDVADLPGLCQIAHQREAVLVVDEAHATGVLGPTGAGLAEQQGVADEVAVTVSTASKALGALGGIITGPRVVIDTLVNHARGFVYTTAVPPTQAAVIGAALDVIADEPDRRRRVLELAAEARRIVAAAGLNPPPTRTVTPIVPAVVGSSRAALRLADHLREAGVFAPAIRFPTVPRGSARVRLSLRADLEDADIERLGRALHGWTV